MRNIPTTKTQLEKLRQRARELRDAEGIKLSAGKERAAVEAGYESWHHAESCCNRLRMELPAATPGETFFGGTILPVEGGQHDNYFYHVEIDGQRFQAAINEEGPYLQKHGQGTIHLGVCGIRKVAKRGRNAADEEPQWYICKHGPNNPVMCLNGLSDDGILCLIRHFGIEYYMRNKVGHKADGFSFYLSPAFEALCAWARKHPLKIKQFGPSPYLPGWAKRAAEEEPRAALTLMLRAEAEREANRLCTGRNGQA